MSGNVDRPIWLATTNPAKVDRLIWLLADLPVRPRLLSEADPIAAPEETGTSYLENACLKAGYYSRRLPGLVIATDGGADIPILGDRWRGIHTGRAAGAADDEGRLAHVLELLAPYHGDDRRAYWNEAVALAQEGRVIASWTAISRPGLLAESYDAVRLMRGFWLANLWTYPELGKTHAEATPAERERVADHWSRLRENLRRDLRSGLLDTR